MLLARAIPFTTQHVYWEKSFYIPLAFEEKTKKEIRSFQRENENWPPVIKGGDHPTYRFSFLSIWIVSCLAFFHWNVTRIDLTINWYNLGRFTADEVLSGDWWRTITATTLHVDDAHFISNFFGLLVFVSGVNFFAGPGFSWFLVLISSAFGNYINALFYQNGHPSIGASTAVFSAIGLMGVFGVRNYYHQKRFKGRYLVPFMAGFGLFAMLGTNPQTDVMAHLFGFTAGSLLGVVTLPLINSKFITRKGSQRIFFLLFCLIVYLSWYIPLHLSGQRLSF